MRWLILVVGVGLCLHACDHPDHWFIFALGLCLMTLGLFLLVTQDEAQAQAQQLEPRRSVSFTVHRGL